MINCYSAKSGDICGALCYKLTLCRAGVKFSAKSYKIYHKLEQLEDKLDAANGAVKKSKKTLQETAKIGNEAHDDLQDVIKKDGYIPEVTITLKDGSKVRKDAIKGDSKNLNSENVIIKPDTKSGRYQAGKRIKKLEKNDRPNNSVILYDPSKRGG